MDAPSGARVLSTTRPVRVAQSAAGVGTPQAWHVAWIWRRAARSAVRPDQVSTAPFELALVRRRSCGPGRHQFFERTRSPRCPDIFLAICGGEVERGDCRRVGQLAVGAYEEDDADMRQVGRRTHTGGRGRLVVRFFVHRSWSEPAPCRDHAARLDFPRRLIACSSGRSPSQ